MGDWLVERLTNVFNGLVEKGLYLLIAGAAFATWRWGSGDVTLPLWLLVLFVGLPLAYAAMVRRRGRQPVTEAAATIDALEREVAIYGYYGRHLDDVLRTVQQKIRGELGDISTDNLVEQGVLQPAREFLQQAPGEDVRLSVLVPRADGILEMRWMAGHRLASKAAFSLPVAGSFSQLALSSGQIEWSFDVDEDHRFTRHPQSESGRGYASIISVPLRAGNATIAVLNVVSTAPYAFTRPDFIFIGLLGAVIEVAWALEHPQGVTPQLASG